MRYLGNKTKLIPFITGAIESLGVRPGVACDPFAGTASVSSALKRAGWTVHAGDLMRASYALQVARVELDRTPRFPGEVLPPSAREGVRTVSYRRILSWLEDTGSADGGARNGDRAEPAPGFIREHYTLAGEAGRRHGRMYFSPENARCIDFVRTAIQRWRSEGTIDRPRAQLLIATLIEAADRVANTTGVYASFVKTLQPNAARDLELRPFQPAARAEGADPCTAFLGPASECVARAGAIDLLYLDPPYNARQYPGYYHIPELLARGWTPPPEIRGKTGLIPDEAQRSEWCRATGAAPALRTVLEAADARHVLLSYNDEGLLDREEIETGLRERGDPDSYRRFTRPYRRYRSDSDGPDRNYRRDRVSELLHYVRCD